MQAKDSYHIYRSIMWRCFVFHVCVLFYFTFGEEDHACSTANATEIECNTTFISNLLADIPANATTLRIRLLAAKAYTTYHQVIINGTFAHLTRLEILIIEHKNTKDFNSHQAIIHSGAFEGLAELKYLRISIPMNYQTVSAHMFTPLVSLEVLDLTRSGFLSQTWLISALSFLPNTTHTVVLKNVETLTVGQWGQILDLSHIACSLNHTAVQILDLSYNGYAALKSYRILECIPDLRELILSHNLFGKDSGIENVDIQRLFFHPSIEVLDISHQWDLTSSTDFWGTRPPTWNKKYPDRLVEDSHGNEYAQLLQKWYSKNEAPASDVLTILDKVKSCTQTTFDKCFQSVDLTKYLAGKFTLDDDSTKEDVCKLISCLFSQDFQLNYCKSIIEALLFAYITQRHCNNDCLFGVALPVAPHLREVYVQYYGTYQPTATFNGGLSLTGQLCLQNNSLSTVDMSGYKNYPEENTYLFNFAPFMGVSMMERLYFENNNFHLWNMRRLEHFSSLKVCSIAKNQVLIHNDTDNLLFANNSQLEEIDLSDNRIVSIPKDEFSHLKHLRILNLFGNNLTNDNFSIHLKHNVQLQLVNISGNRLRGLNLYMQEQFGRFKSRLEIDLSNNPLACTCADADFVQWFQQSEITFTRGGTYTCYSSTGLAQLSDPNLLAALLWECDSKSKITISVLCTALGMVLVTLPLLIYKRRWRIRHKLFLVRERLSRWRESDLEPQPRFEFDAFIIYSDKDRFWVHDVLMKQLEDTYGFTLCLHHKNFLPGAWIQDSIEEAIENSRKVIAVLTPNFLASEWCQLEIQMTCSSDRTKLVIVMLEMVTSQQVPAVISNLLDTRTYLEWKDDQAAKQLFWKMLARAMYRKHRPHTQAPAELPAVVNGDQGQEGHRAGDGNQVDIQGARDTDRVHLRHLIHIPKTRPAAADDTVALAEV